MESTKQHFIDKSTDLTMGDCAMCDLEGFVLHSDFVDLCWKFAIMWTSQVNNLWDICFSSEKSNRMPFKYKITLYLNRFVT